MTYHSHADLGGRACNDRVIPEAEGDLFHTPWEPRALAVTLAMGATGAWNIDMSRAARETLPDYAHVSYYEIWTLGLEALMRERGLMQPDEVEAGQILRPGPALARVLRAADVPAVLAKGSATERPAVVPARYTVGDRVRTRAGEVPHHTRLPRYVRGHVGVVQQVRGYHVFADTHAQGLGEQPQWLYTVVFSGEELWGNEAGARGTSVSVDAWEPYLEAAS